MTVHDCKEVAAQHKAEVDDITLRLEKLGMRLRSIIALDIQERREASTLVAETIQVLTDMSMAIDLYEAGYQAIEKAENEKLATRH